MTQKPSSPDNATSRRLLEGVRADAQAGNGALDGALRSAVFAYASARALGRESDAALPDDVRAFVDAVLARPIDADVAALTRSGRSDDFIYEIAIVAAVAAGSARGRAGFALLKDAAGGAP
jgi:hypothetical protein